MDFNLKQLKVLKAIASTGSVGNAKRVTNLSQPSISMHLTNLENALDTTLITRGRGSKAELTAAGSYWASVAEQILEILDEAKSGFGEQNFGGRLAIKFGSTPSLRGRFSQIVSEIAVKSKNVSRFELLFSLDSKSLVEQLINHRLQVAVVSYESIQDYANSYYIEPLFQDEIVWALPKNVPNSAIKQILNKQRHKSDHPALEKHVEMSGISTWKNRTNNWYSGFLPKSKPFFRCMTYPTALEVVSAGNATCHTPSVCVPYLADGVRRKLKFIKIGQTTRIATLAMPKHLRHIATYRDFFDNVAQSIKSDFPINSDIVLPDSSLK